MAIQCAMLAPGRDREGPCWGFRASARPKESPWTEVTPPLPSGDCRNWRSRTEEKVLSSSRYLAVTWHRNLGCTEGQKKREERPWGVSSRLRIPSLGNLPFGQPQEKTSIYVDDKLLYISNWVPNNTGIVSAKKIIITTILMYHTTSAKPSLLGNLKPRPLLSLLPAY